MQIYEDSIVLHSVFTNARERLEKDGSLPTPAASEDEDATEPEDGGEEDEDSKWNLSWVSSTSSCLRITVMATDWKCLEFA